MIAFPEQRTLETSLEPLTELELQIARRADELAATRLERSALNLACWLEAEQEILGPIFHASRRPLS